MITIDKKVWDGIVAHAKKETPIEACGYCASRNGIIDAWYPLTNIDASAEHFSLDPKEQFACVKELRSSGRKLAGVYHSHPATPARPSAEDIALAADPSLSYLIISLAGSTPLLKSFQIHDKTAVEEPISIIEPEGGHV